MNYYYYIAGMPDISQNNPKSIPDLETLREELREELTAADFKLFSLIAEGMDNADVKQYVSRFDKDPESGEPIELSDEQRAALYYELGMKSRNKFVRQWFEFNLNINNILTAIICRDNGWDIRKAVVGDNTVVNTIRENLTARDFNLKAELDYFPALQQIVETDNLMEREQKIDALKWQWLEDNTFFEFFGVEKIIAFYIRCTLLNRWNILTVEEGERVFREIIDNLKKDVKF
ncbi:MAG: DUF2764 family protein [bacterium]|nr:DUF2764 family protein [Candidatus Colousia faecequi]MCQ2343991.1 DUF2764 domain-containing protein [Paludibacteraceae bacterium]